MRKLLVIVLAVAVMGCAGAPGRYNSPDALNKRIHSITQSTIKCISPSGHIAVHVGQSSQKIVYIRDNEHIVFSEGMFVYNDDALKFFMAHEIAHNKLGHSAKRKTASLITTGAMMVAGFFVPGAGLLNYGVNPAVVNNYSKSQEFEADTEAAKACIECMGISKDSIIKTMLQMSTDTKDGGDFWSTHPSWNERIENIKISPHSPAQTAPASPPPSGKASGKTPSP